MLLARAIEILADRVRTWTDEKLAIVLAFAEDGKMQYSNPCCCFLGVESFDVMHDDRSACGGYAMHYHRAVADEGSRLAEEAYYQIGQPLVFLRYQEEQAERTRQFIAILRAEIARRDATADRIRGYIKAAVHAGE